jgi:hypothetical protein
MVRCLGEGTIGDRAQKVRLSIEMEVFAVHGESHEGRLKEDPWWLQFGVV